MGGCCSAPHEELLDDYQEDDPTGGLSEAYEVKHLLGSGSAGDAWLCQERSTGDVVAIKLIKRPIPPLMGTSLMREVKIGAELGKGHLNIVKPREVVLTRTHLGLVMEYVAGGNMADYILRSILLKFGHFENRDGLVMEEDEALYFFKQIMSAVEYCHKHQVAHRDLKMDNTLLDDHDPPRIKLCDFGFARNWNDQPEMTTITGTPDYMSPQLLGAKLGAPSMKAQYDGTKVDIWAAGVMLCVMLIGRFPFEGTEMSNVTNLDDVSEHVWQQQTQTTSKWYDNPLIAHDCSLLSPDCIDLLDKMFELDESQRITVSGIKAHPWFTRTLPPLYRDALEQLRREQEVIDQQVAAGAFLSRDRDSALKTIIWHAATHFNPEEEEAGPGRGAASYVEGQGSGGDGSGGGGGGLRPKLDEQQRMSSLLRKISLTSLKPAEYKEVAAAGHADLATISKFFREAGAPGAVPTVAEGNEDDAATTAGAASAAATATAAELDAAAEAVLQLQQQQLDHLEQQQQQEKQEREQQQPNGGSGANGGGAAGPGQRRAGSELEPLGG